MPLEPLLTQIRACQVCASALPLGANPVVQAHSEAKILIIGQAPGTKVHHTSIPWNDASGNRLRAWLDIEKQTFYDPKQIAIMPMGFCYPGQGQSGDLPPRKECAPLWHEALLKHLPNIELTLLIGQYAQNRYLSNKPKTLTETVQNWQAWLPDYLPLPHPSPRNTLWLRKNPWFEEQTVPYLRQQVHQRLSLSKVER
ncbi:uracil-DNA glycosylase family protein [Vibrio vulnificus]|jgi:uracil-DNA glycosylase|uniref:Uracil-DNA glycosylase family protein n=1 Tax=Vibrio vulnificus TaxID=672 RepID=A0A2S3T0D8_VIBVL|nr:MULTISPECIES: uracil-DNA glycosylase family protein [Vibrio]EGQ7935852.1 uracil-DNA glycosylase family protein [Vibrio vulnificus]EGQ7952509.1 uracil-DNA glycosylase family protein [Vibrio vulnificus]EGQ7964579.1 uracil-DNA glycosylase family protein [Vibrio vulnificus]EGQ7992393.1 uracil-DNA glycosylase family protein [Vibrio vulnificus]EGQ8023354.1 uracil-DNA glycosylase family protein [Vibrio vulnificus]